MRHLSLLLAVCAITLSADVTVHYKVEIKSPLAAAMPQAAEQLKKMPSDITMQVKGVKARSDSGAVIAIADVSSNQVIVLDTAGKKYAEATQEQYLSAIVQGMPALPDAVKQLMAMLKVNTDSKMTGRTATIATIEGEERQITLTVDSAGIPGAPAGPLMRFVISAWTSKESEAARVPAIREMSAISQSALAGSNGLENLKKILDMLPGVGDGVKKLLQDLHKPNSMLLRMNFDMFMPMIADAMKQMPAGQNPLGAGVDPNGSLMQMSEELTSLSTDPVAASQFQAPTDYTKESIEDFAKEYMTKLTATGTDK